MPPRPHTPSPRPQTRDNKTLTDEGLSPRTRANREVDKMLIDVADIPDIPNPNRIPKLPKFRRPEKDRNLRKGMTIICRKKADRHNKNAWYKVKTVEKTRKTTTGNKMPMGPYWTVIRDKDDEAISWYEWSHDWYEEGEERPDWIQNYVAVLDSDDESEDESPDFDPTYVVLTPSSQHRHPEVVKAKEKEINNFKAYKAFLSNGFIQGERNRCNILSWKCTKLDQACTNTTEAETIAMANAFSEADMIKETIMEATSAPEDLINVEVFCDSKNAIENAKSLRVTDKILPFRGYTAKVRQALNTGKVRKLEQVGDEFQIADNLTKLTSTRQDLITTLTQGRFFV